MELGCSERTIDHAAAAAPASSASFMYGVIAEHVALKERRYPRQAQPSSQQAPRANIRTLVERARTGHHPA